MERLEYEAYVPMAERKLAEIGRAAGLAHVYLGNVRDATAGRTSCPGCGAVLIERHGFSARSMVGNVGACTGCGRQIEGVWA